MVRSAKKASSIPVPVPVPVPLHPRSTDLDKAVQTARMVANPVRLRILAHLQQGESNVTDMCESLDLPQPLVSNHLGLLKIVGLLKCRRDCQRVIYELEGEWVTDLLAALGV